MSSRARLERWRTCLHEAGHAVAALGLLGAERAGAVIWRGGGAADVGGDDGADPPSFRSAVVAAAGRHAERLAIECPAPRSRPAKLERRPDTARTMARLSSEAAAALSDDDAIRAWSMAGPGLDWRQWRRRLVTTHWAARQFVREHQVAIIETARELYRRGVISIERSDVTPRTVRGGDKAKP